MQEILAYIILIFAVSFLLKKLFFKPKKNTKECNTNCGCA